MHYYYEYSETEVKGKCAAKPFVAVSQSEREAAFMLYIVIYCVNFAYFPNAWVEFLKCAE